VFAQKLVTCVIPELVRRPGLPIQDYTASPNNYFPWPPRLSTVHVIDKAIFERFYLVPGQTPIYALFQHSFFAHTPTAHVATISGFSAGERNINLPRNLLRYSLGIACSKARFETSFTGFFPFFWNFFRPAVRNPEQPGRSEIEGLGGNTQSPAQSP